MTDLNVLLRTAIGFDRLSSLIASAQEAAAPTYPPYNIEVVGEDAYRLTIAVAGFSADNLDITAHDGTLVVIGKAAKAADAPRMLHQGIAGRAFERRFTLADHMVVEGADLKLGLLHVDLRRVVPEALKPRKIDIGTAAQAASDEESETEA